MNLKSRLFQPYSNVCLLDFDGNLVVSGSRDHLAIIYNLATENIMTLYHPGTVLCVKILQKRHLITVCAENKLRIFNKSNTHKEISYSTAPIRVFICVSELIYTIDNYFKVHKIHRGGK